MNKFKFIVTMVCASILISCGDGGIGPAYMPMATPPPATGSALDSIEIGNGGDLIQCGQRPPQFELPYDDGWYVLDYVEDRGGARFQYDSRHSLKAHVLRLRNIVSNAAPELLAGFDEFMEAVPFFEGSGFRATMAGVDRVWVATNQNEEINDENPSYIPPNCRMRRDTKSLRLHQVVVRKEFVNGSRELKKVKYFYDRDLIDKIGDRDLQMSLLLLHEWLWDFYPSDEGRALRRANRTLHSMRVRGMPREQIRGLLIYKKKPPRERPSRGKS